MATWPKRYLPDQLSDDDKILAESSLMLLRTGQIAPQQIYKYYGYSSEVVCRWHITKFLAPGRTSPYSWSDIIVADSVELWKAHRHCYMHEQLMCGDCPFFRRERHRENVGKHVMLRFGQCEHTGKRRERCDFCQFYNETYGTAEEDGVPLPYQNSNNFANEEESEEICDE